MFKSNRIGVMKKPSVGLKTEKKSVICSVVVAGGNFKTSSSIIG
jgi:hypothetical protein